VVEMEEGFEGLGKRWLTVHKNKICILVWDEQ
jgi:hypothetical protein